MDSWCKPLIYKNGQVLYGGAARNVRISRSGGMDTILQEVAMEAARNALIKANQRSSQGRSRSNVVPLPVKKKRA